MNRLKLKKHNYNHKNSKLKGTTEHKHKTTSSTDWKDKKLERHVLEFRFGMEMEEEDEKHKETYVVGDLGGVHLKDEWLQDECSCCHLRVQECTEDKTRREEDRSLSQFSLTNLGEVLYSQNQFYYFKASSPPFIRRRIGHLLQKKLTIEVLQGCLLTLPILAPKWRVKRQLLDFS